MTDTADVDLMLEAARLLRARRALREAIEITAGEIGWSNGKLRWLIERSILRSRIDDCFDGSALNAMRAQVDAFRLHVADALRKLHAIEREPPGPDAEPGRCYD